MQIILASAKIMNDKVKSSPDISLSSPRFQNEADCFVRDMVHFRLRVGCFQSYTTYTKVKQLVLLRLRQVLHSLKPS